MTRALATNGAPASTSPPSFSRTRIWSMLTSAPGSASIRSTVTTVPGVTFTWRPPL
jgi:hypothetical protein